MCCIGGKKPEILTSSILTCRNLFNAESMKNLEYREYIHLSKPASRGSVRAKFYCHFVIMELFEYEKQRVAFCVSHLHFHVFIHQSGPL